LLGTTVRAQVAFTAILSGKEGVVAKAVVGLPGLASDPQFATFPSYTQANEFAQRRENCACAVVIAIALLNWNGYSLYWKLV
jgi:hypothetical protein